MNTDFNNEIYSSAFQANHGIHLIEASAGTGKTFNIQNLYARFIMETDFRVANILVMTYTEAATKELRERLHAVLEDLQWLFAGKPLQGKHKDDREKRAAKLISCACPSLMLNVDDFEGIDAFLEQTKKLISQDSTSKDAWNMARGRVELALLEFDNAAISTIHGFCKRVLTRYAFETGMNDDQEIMNNKNAELEARAIDWWRTHKDIPLKDLKNYVRKLGEKTDYSIITKDSIIITINYLTKIKSKCSKDSNFPNIDNLLNALLKMLDNNLIINNLDVIELQKVLKYTIDAKITGVTADAKKVFKIWSNYMTLKTISEGIVQKYESERLERESLSFDDLIRALRDALNDEANGKALADKLREEYKVALIDEFQDTDPCQFDIFKRIFMDEAHPCPLYFVGDPKQAIYAFRGGDIYTYLKAKSAKGLQTNIIKVNHRSIKRLVDAVNYMFKETNVGETFGDTSIPFIPSDVEKEPTQIKGTPLEQPLQIIEFTIEEGKSLSKDNTKPVIWNMMLCQILDILNQENEGKRIFSPKDIAILINTNKDMPKLQEALLAKGIPCVIRNPGNVFGTSIAFELKVFLEAIAEVGASSSNEIERLRAALLTVFGGKTPTEIDALKNPESMSQYIEFFKQMKSIWCSRGGFAALSNKMEQNGYLQRLSKRPNAERLLSDIGQIMELCCAATKEVGSTPDALVNWLTKRISDSNDQEEEHDSDEYERELETDGDAVKIMTLHSSKGLQFPIVFLPDCWRLCSSNDPRNKFPLPYYHDKDNQNQFVFALGDDSKKKAEAELHLEKYRLLYVALTRSIQQTVLFTPSLEAFETLNGKEPLSILLQNLKKNAVVNPPYQWIKNTEVKEPEEAYTPDNEDGAAKPIFEPPSFAKLPPVRGSYSSLTPGDKKDDDDSRDCDEDDFFLNNTENEELHPIFRLPSGARLGTCWHNILEKIDFNADSAEIEKTAKAELIDSGFKPDALIESHGKKSDRHESETTIKTTIKMLEDTLNHTLTAPNGEQFTLRDIPWKDRLSEQEFNYSSANAEKTIMALKDILLKHWENKESKNEFCKAINNWGEKDIPHGYLIGFMDLVFRHNGYYYVIDWKSNSMEGDIERFNDDGIREEMAKHGYFFQYMLYAAVLHTYLKSSLGSKYSWERNFGGVRYYFLRGITAGGVAPVFEDRPSEELLDEFAKALGMEVK